jgi:TRAP-type C4-dicarboxylate transport system permease small subunit
LQPVDRREDEELFAELLKEEAAAPDPGWEMAPEDWLTFALFWSLAGVVFLQFFTRYILNDSLAWTEEIARYQLMALTFVGSATAARRGAHIAVDFFLLAMPPGARRLARVAVAVLTIAFYAMLTWLCWQVAEAMRFQPMVVVDLPLAYVYWAILVGLVLTTLRAIQCALREFRHGAAA